MKEMRHEVTPIIKVDKSIQMRTHQTSQPATYPQQLALE